MINTCVFHCHINASKIAYNKSQFNLTEQLIDFIFRKQASGTKQKTLIPSLWNIVWLTEHYFRDFTRPNDVKETPQKDAMFALKMEEENNLDMTLRDAMLDYVELHILYILSHKRELF